MDSAERPGVRHLATLARQPRPAGSAAEREARRYAEDTLRAMGFAVTEEPFEYSAFPGRFATPIGGAMLGGAILKASAFALAGLVGLSVATLAAGVALTGAFAWWMSGDGVLTVPWMRRTGINVAAVRNGAPRVWLVAHLDSKSQPVPSALRIGGIILLVAALAVALISTALTLRGVETRMVWWGAMVLAIVGMLPVVSSMVGTRSDGAVDNASGVATVLAAAALLPDHVTCGVLLPSAEELGLAGARAWARDHPSAVALNCDGVDDDGRNVIMYNGVRPARVVDALAAAAHTPFAVRRMPPGLLTDSTAFASRGWQAVTVSRGSVGTLRRVHTAHDSLNHLKGVAVDDVAAILARAAEALAS